MDEWIGGMMEILHPVLHKSINPTIQQSESEHYDRSDH
jgi:hypothetical protein